MREAYLWPINAEDEGTPRQVRALIDTVRRSRVPVVFCESTVNDRPIRQVAREAGVRYGGALYVDSLTGPDGPAPTYLKLLETNADIILRGFFGNQATR
jgi:manganese/iron transport system substrate-binding protein